MPFIDDAFVSLGGSRVGGENRGQEEEAVNLNRVLCVLSSCFQRVVLSFAFSVSCTITECSM